MTTIASRKNIFVGRIRDLDTGRVTSRVYLDVELREVDGTWRTTNHEPIYGYTELNICGTEYYANGGPSCDGRIHSIGQNIAALDEINDLAGAELSLFQLRWLRQVWQRSHLNGMNAGCAHQTVEYETDRYGRRVPSLTDTDPCPVTGYQYGTAWLVKELPAALITELVETLKLGRS